MKYLMIILVILTTACGRTASHVKEDNRHSEKVMVPEFQPDSAYQFVAEQVNFGPRVPNTESHKLCAQYLIDKLQQYGAKTNVQEVQLTAWDGTSLNAKNIIGTFNPGCKKRVMLCSHWDSRPFADNDTDENNWKKTIPGANDGASGVGVLLEVARQLQQKPTDIGIDIIFFDAEDYGIPEWWQGPYKDATWCLGSQHWGRHPHTDHYFARYGILLDMVGGRQATFYHEGYSKRTAPKQVKHIWETANKLGFGSFFINKTGAEVVDDHIYVHQFAGIPCVDIINYQPNSERSSFGETWHTVNDDLEHIDKNTLKAVGQTVLEVIYNEK